MKRLFSFSVTPAFTFILSILAILVIAVSAPGMVQAVLGPVAAPGDTEAGSAIQESPYYGPAANPAAQIGTLADTGIFGTVGIGTSSPVSPLHIYSTTSTQPETIDLDGAQPITAQWNDYSNTGGAFSGSGFLARFARGTRASPTNVQAGDRLGFNVFGGWVGGAFRHTAAIEAMVDTGTVSDTSLPTYLKFSTTPSGSTTRVEAMRITGDGRVGIATTPSANPAMLQVEGPSQNAVYGHSSGGAGVFGASDFGNGVYGETNSLFGAGVYGRGPSEGIAGNFLGSVNISDNLSVGDNLTVGGKVGIGTAIAKNGQLDVETTSNQNAVYGSSGGNRGIGVYGTAGDTNGIGVFGINTSWGNYGYLGDNYSGVSGTGGTVGVFGSSTGGTGVYGYNEGSYKGVWGYSNSGYGVYGNTTSGYAGYFDGKVKVSGTENVTGDLNITGTLRKGAGTFLIDHPVDPENKYLQHSFVESPDMKNIYDGNIVLNDKGEATVELPSYFEALNRDFRYQLTCIGGASLVYIAEEINGDHFKIAGGKPGLKVSWMVTGIRQDAFAKAHPIVVEQEKPANEKGLYLHPIEWGQPKEKGISTALNK